MFCPSQLSRQSPRALRQQKANNASPSKSLAENANSRGRAAGPERVWLLPAMMRSGGEIAALHQDDAKLDQASIAFMDMQNPQAALAGLRSVSKGVVENPLVRLVSHVSEHDWHRHREERVHAASATARVVCKPRALTPDVDVKDLKRNAFTHSSFSRQARIHG